MDILRIPKCNKCNKEMTKVRSSKYRYRCYLRRDLKKWSNEGSLLKDSIFQSSRLDVEDILILLCEWIKGSSHAAAIIELDTSIATVSRWFTRFNNRVYNYYYRHITYQTIGGPGCIVEIDETLLVRNKYHNGRQLQYQVWGVGGVVRGDASSFFFEVVENRSRSTLIELIKRKIAAESTIITDCWRGYLGLENICVDLGYTHETVNHSNNFVDPETGAHTQTIEGMWSVIKRVLRKEGTNHGSLLNVVRKIYIRRFKLLYQNNLLDVMLNFMKISSDSNLPSNETSAWDCDLINSDDDF